jgi:hypothetical protein
MTVKAAPFDEAVGATRRSRGRPAAHQVSVICEPAQSRAYTMAGLFDGADKNEEVHPSRGAAIRNRCPNSRHPQPLRSPAGRGGLRHFRLLDAGDAARVGLVPIFLALAGDGFAQRVFRFQPGL